MNNSEFSYQNQAIKLQFGVCAQALEIITQIQIEKYFCKVKLFKLDNQSVVLVRTYVFCLCTYNMLLLSLYHITMSYIMHVSLIFSILIVNVFLVSFFNFRFEYFIVSQIRIFYPFYLLYLVIITIKKYSSYLLNKIYTYIAPDNTKRRT